MFENSKKWKELITWIDECRSDGAASSFRLLTTNDEIIIITNKKHGTIYRKKRMRK